MGQNNKRQYGIEFRSTSEATKSLSLGEFQTYIESVLEKYADSFDFNSKKYFDTGVQPYFVVKYEVRMTSHLTPGLKNAFRYDPHARAPRLKLMNGK